jgi:SET domain-containing protein
MMLLIQKSTIEGRGLFTDSPIAARTKVGEFTGEHIAVREARRRARNRKRIAIVELNCKEAIDGCVRGGPFRYINHSCSPNVFIRVAYDRVEFYAKRDIAAGEEMTVDYGVSHHNGQLRCKCKSLQCRDFI